MHELPSFKLRIVLCTALLCLGGLGALPSAAPAQAPVTCHKVVSPTGSDSAAGSAQDPYRSLVKLASSLQPGQTGCLRGTFEEPLRVVNRGVTITSYPGERAKVVGKTSASADGVTIAGLDLVATDIGPLVYGSGVTFRDNDVTNDHRGITCFLIGDAANRPKGTVLEGNRIHDCGRLPATNLDHGIYVLNADGARIAFNQIYGNADRGVQLYSNADRVQVTNNVIDGNGQGVIFGGTGSLRSEDNVVERNVITNSRIRDNIESYWGPGGSTSSSHGNVARDNCIFGGRKSETGGLETRYGGFTASGNVVAEPQYVDRAAGDFRLRSDSRCLELTGNPATGAGAGSRRGPSGTASRSARAAVTLRRSRRVVRSGRLVRLSGSVKLPGDAGAARPRVELKLRGPKGWRRVRSVPAGRAGRFSVRVRTHRSSRPRRLRLRASVAGVGLSRSVYVRVRTRS